MKYYELICKSGVIGVCSEDGLLHALKEDNILQVGLITDEQQESYGDNPWAKPISKIRFFATIEEMVKLKDIINHKEFFLPYQK